MVGIQKCHSKRLSGRYFKSIKSALEISEKIHHSVHITDFNSSNIFNPKNAISARIMNYINKTINYNNIVVFEYNNVKTTVNVYTKYYGEIDKYIKLIKLAVVSSMLNKERYEDPMTMNIDIFATDLRKTFPNGTGVIDKGDVNSGFSNFDNNIHICIYREEEWFKTLLHELFFAFSIDIQYDGINFENILSFSFNVNANYSLVDPIIEFWARLYNAAVSAFFSEDTISPENFAWGFEKNVDAERIHSIKQTNVLLSTFGLDYPSIIDLKRGGVRKVYNEKTNALGYYILTSIMMFHFDRTMQWMNIGDNLFDITKNERELVIFTHYIAHGARSDELVNTFENVNFKKVASNSAKMTVCDI